MINVTTEIFVLRVCTVIKIIRAHEAPVPVRFRGGFGQDGPPRVEDVE